MSDIDVVRLPAADHVRPGETAPDFTRPLVNRDYWEDAALSSLLDDGPVLLVPFPMDGTGTSKGLWIEIRNRGWGGDDLSVVGISISTPYEHKHLLDRHDLPYGLFSDPGAGVAERYGVPHDYHGMSGIVGHRFSFFLIDRSRTVTDAWVADRWPPRDKPFDEVEDAIDSL